MKQVIVCINRRLSPRHPSCAAKGSELIAERLEREIAARGWEIEVGRFRCLGQCQQGPALKLSPGGPFICGVSPEELDEALQQIEAFSSSAD